MLPFILAKNLKLHDNVKKKSYYLSLFFGVPTSYPRIISFFVCFQIPQNACNMSGWPNYKDTFVSMHFLQLFTQLFTSSHKAQLAFTKIPKNLLQQKLTGSQYVKTQSACAWLTTIIWDRKEGHTHLYVTHKYLTEAAARPFHDTLLLQTLFVCHNTGDSSDCWHVQKWRRKPGSCTTR